MKKVYCSPESNVINIEMEQQVLMASGATGTGIGGDAVPDMPVLSRDLPWAGDEFPLGLNL